MDRVRAEQEALNYHAVLRYLPLVCTPDFKLSEKTIKRINEISLHKVPMAYGAPGVYKSLRIGVPGKLEGADPAEVRRLMRELVADANQWLSRANPAEPENHPVIVAAHVMWELLFIHPFSEGNGRTSRAVATLILMRHGYLARQGPFRSHPVMSLEWFFDRNRDRYVECLHLADQGRPNPWYRLFTEAVDATMEVIGKDKLSRLPKQDAAAGQVAD